MLKKGLIILKNYNFIIKIMRGTVGAHWYNLLQNELYLAILWYNMLSNSSYLVCVIFWYIMIYSAI